ncbi:MAG TPA: glycosyltransferase [Candidatus Moranbacteria bacterium]|nr:glycosyltransferase [Candidatus Moranbacteria bacterium]
MDDVIESFLKISQEIPKAKLSLAVRIKNRKDAQKKKEISSKLKKRHLLKQVVFHDNGQYDMADIYNLADISVFPARNMRGKFDVPLAVIEAMACEKPVIISNLPILQEFVNNKNSVIINPGDVSQLSREILKL